MAFYHGVTVTLVDDGTRPIELPASSIIGLVGTYNPQGAGNALPNTPTLITRLSEGVKLFGQNDGTGVYTIPQALEAIYTQAAAVVVVIGVPVGQTEAETISNIIGEVNAQGMREGAEALLDAKSVTGQKPRILIAPEYSSEQAVATKLDSIAGKLRAMAYIDGPNTNDDAAQDYALNFGSKRLYLIDPSVRYWDTAANAEQVAPASAYAAGLTALNDKENGYWASPSNKEIKGILGTVRPIDYEYGDETCRANLLNNGKIATIIREGGYRLWGNRTLAADPKWKYITRVRTTDMVMDAILAGHQWAIDRGLTRSYIRDVEEGLRAFMSGERAKGAIINFDVWVDKERTTASEIESGKAYWRVKFSDVPPAENPNFLIEVTNEYMAEIVM
jgi:hypothetical protein